MRSIGINLSNSAADSITFFQPGWPLLFSFVASGSEVEF